MRQMPVRIVSDGVVTRTRARHRGVLPRGREGLPRAAPAADRRPHPARPRPAADRRAHRGRRPRRRRPEVTELTLKTGRAARGARPPGRAGGRPGGASFPDDFLLYWSILALFLARSGPPAARPRPGTRPASTTSPTGWPGTPAATCTGCRARSAGCAGRRRRRRSSTRRYDVALTPTLATETPRDRPPRPDARTTTS